MGTPKHFSNIFVSILSYFVFHTMLPLPLPYISNEESVFHFHLLFLLLLASPEEMAWVGGGAEVLLFPVSLSLVTFPFFLYFSPFFFYSHSSQPAPRVRERYGFSAISKFTLMLLYIHFYVSLPFEYYSNRNSLLAKVA